METAKKCCTMINVASFGLLMVWLGLVVAFTRYNNDRFEGDSCKLADNVTNGICRFADVCPSLKRIPQKFWRTCSFEKDRPIVCCEAEKEFTTFAASTNSPVRLSSRSKLECDGFPATSDLTEHIFEGVEAVVNEFPYVAALGYPAEETEVPFRCGASLISNRFLLTAAHCLRPTKPTYARLGVVNLFDYHKNDPPVDVPIKNYTIHPNYKKSPLMNDIALLELSRNITESFLQPACLYTDLNDPPPDVTLTVTGWGSVDSHASSLSPNLLKAYVSTVERGVCNVTLADENSFRSPEGQLCALGRNKLGETTGDTCVGDSGGPLELTKARQRFVVGVTSSGMQCGSKWPGIYTRVSRYVDWIESIVWP